MLTDRAGRKKCSGTNKKNERRDQHMFEHMLCGRVSSRPAVKWLDGVDGGHNIDSVGREWNDRGFIL